MSWFNDLFVNEAKAALHSQSGSGGSGGAQSDWNQNNSTAPDYVKNRPFWTDDPVETDIIAESTHTIEAGSYYNIEDANFNLVEGETYKVVWDGVEYELTARNNGYYDIYIGNQAAVGFDGWEFPDANDSDAPFFIYSWGEGIISVVVMTSGTYTLRFVAAIKEVHKIDEKYLSLPNTLVHMGNPALNMPIVNLWAVFDCMYFNNRNYSEVYDCTYEQWNVLRNAVDDSSTYGKHLLCAGTDMIAAAAAYADKVWLTMNSFDQRSLTIQIYTSTVVFNEDEQTVTVTYTYVEKKLT